MEKSLKGHIVFFVLFIFSTAYSQQRLDFNLISGKEGLTENVVNDVVQDKKGFIWLATNDGLNRYDGYNMIYFRYDPSKMNSLSSNVLTTLKVAGNGILWIGTSDGGLNRYDPETSTFSCFQNNPADATTLSSGMIDNIEEDNEGNIWINIRNKGIDRLVVKRNKTQFIHYNTHNLGNNYLAVLKSNTTTGLSKSAMGGVWVCSEKGIQHLKADTDKPDNLNNWGVYAHNPVKNIIESDAKTLWVAYKDGTILNFGLTKNSSGVAVNLLSDYKVNAFQGNVTLDIDQQNELWIGTGYGLFKVYNKSVFSYYYGQYPLNNLPTNRILCTFVDRDNVLWLGTYNYGVLNFPLNQQLFYVFDDLLLTKEEKSNQFFNNAIHSFCEDRTGALWIGSEGGGIMRIAEGVNAFIDKSKSAKLHIDFISRLKTPWLLDNNIYCLYVDSKQRLWIGSSEGLTQISFKPSYKSGQSLSVNDVAIKYFTLKESEYQVFGEGAVFALAEDKFGTVWAAKWNGGLHRYLENENRFEGFHPNPAQQGSISHNTVRAILFEPNGEAWIGTAGGGLNKMIFPNGSKGKPYFICYKNNPNDPQSLSNNYILNLQRDKSGNLWVGTFGGGLNKMIRNNAGSHKVSFKRFTVENQLPGNTIKGLIFDNENKLWAATNRDLFRMNITTGSITQLISSDKFKIDEFKDNANYIFKNGYLMWGGINGLVIFSPKKTEQKNSRVSPCLTNIIVDNKQINPGERVDNIYFEKSIQYTAKIVLPYNKNTIEIQFSGMDYSNTKGIVYRYYLEGYDNNPVVSNKSGVRYTKIPFGSYKFHLNASADGVDWCDKDVVLQIRISPPFWLSIYAVLLYVLFTIGVVYLVYRFIKFRFKLESQIKIEQIKNDEKEKINNLKLQFFTNISHELRTPLNLITNPIDSLVSDPEMTTVQLRLLKMVQHNTQRLHKLITQLLDFRKIEAGVLSLKLVKADILPFIYDIYRSFDDVARNKAINYRFSCSEALLVCIFDPDKIEKILYNLLSNAIKFTPANGTVILTVSRESSSQNGSSKHKVSDFLKIEVLDTGMGIKTEDQDKIFQYFYQSEQNKLEKNTGSGIGLAYVNNIVKVHFGSIHFESQPNEGTKFTVLLPLNSDVYAMYEIDNTTTPSQSESLEIEIKDLYDSLNGRRISKMTKNDQNKTVLIVDDNEELLSYLKIELAADYNIITATNGSEGIEVAKEFLPDIIISDLMMPEMDGIQMCKILKTKLETCHIPIIILTAKADESSEKQGLETGADEYLLKPIKTTLLRLRIKNLLETRSNIYTHISLNADKIEFQQATQAKDQEFLKKVSDIIRNSLDTTDTDTLELSKLMGVSRSSLYKRIKQITGMSTTEYVRFVKLNEAVELFKMNKYSIEQVTFMVGFSDTKYFRKCFKLVFGSSPSEYIKKLKGTD